VKKVEMFKALIKDLNEKSERNLQFKLLRDKDILGLSKSTDFEVTEFRSTGKFIDEKQLEF
jgi:hypothetical protein